MTDKKDAPWWWGYDDERFQGPFLTREDALADAKDEAEGQGFYLAQATQYPPLKLSEYFHAEQFAENAEDDGYEFSDPEGGASLFDIRTEQMKDLQAMVRAAIDTWQEKHKLVFQPWPFQWRGKSEWVEGDTTQGDR